MSTFLTPDPVVVLGPENLGANGGYWIPLGVGGLECLRRDAKETEGVGCWEVVSPSPLWERSGNRAMPPPQKIFQLLVCKW